MGCWAGWKYSSGNKAFADQSHGCTSVNEGCHRGSELFTIPFDGGENVQRLLSPDSLYSVCLCFLLFGGRFVQDPHSPPGWSHDTLVGLEEATTGGVKMGLGREGVDLLPPRGFGPIWAHQQAFSKALVLRSQKTGQRALLGVANTSSCGVSLRP